MATPAHNIFWYMALILCALPVMYPAYPPMVDLPQHVGAVAVIESVLMGDHPYAMLLDMTWLTPYWLGYLLVWLVGQIFGYVWGAKIVIAAAIWCFVLACRAIRRYVGAPHVLDWLLVVVPFGFAFEWGFLNFLIALPLGVLALLQYFRFLDGQSRWWVVSGFFALLFFAHVLVTAFFGAVCLLVSMRKERALKQVLISWLPLMVVIPLGVLWVLTNFKPSIGAGPWEMGVHRFYQLFPNVFSLSFTWVNAAVSLGLLLVPFLFGARFVFQFDKAGPFLFYLLFMLFFPNYLFGNYFTYNRFNSVGLVLYFLAFDFSLKQVGLQRVQNFVGIVVPLIACVFLGRNIAIAIGYDRESGSFQPVVEAMEPNQRVLGLIAARESAFYKAPVYLHYQLWYQAEKGGLADFNFAYWPGLNLTYKRTDLPPVDDSFPWYPASFDWDRHNAVQYRYFVVKGGDDFAAHVLGKHVDKVSLIMKVNDWFLFENRRYSGAGKLQPAAVNTNMHQE